MKDSRKKLIAVLQAMLVTFLWSTSFIIIKTGLTDIPPVTFAGLRYFPAFLCFLPVVLRKNYRTELKSLNRYDAGKLILLGIVFYTATQGAQFIGLSLLPPVTVSLMLNFSPLAVAVLGALFLNEKPSAYQLSGILLFIAGILLYFSQAETSAGSARGIAVMAGAVLANALSSVMGRDINRKKRFSPVTVTFISMGTGSVLLLVIGLSKEGIPVLSPGNMLSLAWLAVINTAFAFTLWNHSLRTLSAMESSIINGTMLIQIALLSAVFLHDSITVSEGAGMLLAAAGAVFVQIKKRGGRQAPSPDN